MLEGGPVMCSHTIGCLLQQDMERKLYSALHNFASREMLKLWQLYIPKCWQFLP